MTLTTFESVTRPQGVAELAAATAAHDGIAPLSEAFLNGLSDTRLGHTHIVARRGGEIVGVAAIDGDTAELFVVPQARRQGVGRELFEQLPQGTKVWAHGNLPGAQALAHSADLRQVRHLVVMGIADKALAQAAPDAAPDATAGDSVNSGLTALNLVEASEKFGRNAVEQAWLAANNEAFDWHPEQGGWDMDRLHRAQEADWFDPADVWFLYDGDALAGFHWTKWHGNGLGEVYVIGLASAFRSKGLGTPLLAVGIAGLKRKGAEKVILYVEADNAPAVKAYDAMGFSIEEDHVVWAR